MTNLYTIDEKGNLKLHVSYINKDNKNRILDMEIAEKFFGWYGFEYDEQFDDWAGTFKTEYAEDYWKVPPFTEEIQEAFKLVNRLNELKLIVSIETFNDYNYVEIKQNALHGEYWVAEAETLPNAICLAASKIDKWALKTK